MVLKHLGMAALGLVAACSTPPEPPLPTSRTHEELARSDERIYGIVVGAVYEVPYGAMRVDLETEEGQAYARKHPEILEKNQIDLTTEAGQAYATLHPEILHVSGLKVTVDTTHEGKFDVEVLSSQRTPKETLLDKLNVDTIISFPRGYLIETPMGIFPLGESWKSPFWKPPDIFPLRKYAYRIQIHESKQ